MTDLVSFDAGGYSYIPGVFQYSAGVKANDGFEIVRARLRRPLPLAEGFKLVEAHIAAAGRSPQAFCACELRSPAPFSEDGFATFNRQYVGWLERWKIVGNDVNPVARTNVCPQVSPPESPSLYAFSYTRPASAAGVESFVVAGSGEAPEGRGNYRDNAIRLGDRSVEGLTAKAQWVLGEMERRMKALGATWADATGAHLYTIYNVHPFLESEIVSRGAAHNGLNWCYARPPVQDLDYEMDVRGISTEIVI